MGRKRGKRLKIFFLLFLASTALVLAVLFFFSGPKEKMKVPSPPKEASPAQPSEPPLPRQVTLYFPSESDDLLHPEAREIRASTPEKEAQEIIEELIAGSHVGYLSPFPPEVELRQVYISGDGTAYVDFSRDLVERHPSGSAAEMTTIYSVVNSLTSNIKAIKRVFFLVEGTERETLSGHINLNQSFSFFPSIIAR